MTDALLMAPSRLEAQALSEGLGRPVAACGVGLVAAALGAAALLAERRPQRVLLAGLAGSRDLGVVGIRQVVVVETCLNEGVGAGPAEAFLPLGALGIPGEDPAPDRLELADPGAFAADLPRAAAGTVAATSRDRAQAQALRAARPEALLEDMETWAVAVACRAAGVPLAAVRAVSNEAGQRDKAHWDLPGSLAALVAALAQA